MQASFQFRFVDQNRRRMFRRELFMQLMSLRLHYQNVLREDSAMQRLFTLFLAVPLLVGPLGIPLHATAPASTRTATSKRTTTPSDAEIEAAIRTKLAKSKIGKDGFRFRVQRGVVTWDGSTTVMQHKGSATRMARTAGAVQVINNIQVSATAKAKASSSLKKASIQPE